MSVAILVNNLHLLHNGRLATFTRAYCRTSAFCCAHMREAHSPRSRILHSRRNLLESSSSLRSMAWLLFFCSVSSPPASVLPQAPMAEQSAVTKSGAARGGAKCRLQLSWELRFSSRNTDSKHCLTKAATIGCSNKVENRRDGGKSSARREKWYGRDVWELGRLMA